MKKIIFLCVENSCRSQIAEAFAKIHSNNKVKAISAGSNPSGKINPKAINTMKEIGYDLNVHKSTSTKDLPVEKVEAMISMGCGDECPHVPAERRIEWDIPDPKDFNEEKFKEIRDLIELEVKQLLKALKVF